MNLSDIKKNVDLREYGAKNFGIFCNPRGFALCPFHDENNPSFEIRKFNGTWTWKDWHDGESGSIVDLVARIRGIDAGEACRQLLEEFRE